MNFNERLRALEAAAGVDVEPFDDLEYRVDLEREILEQRLVPLPPLSAVDVDATARRWAERGERSGFVMNDGGIRTAAELETL